MIDTVQMGIQKVFRIQRDRYFPLPDYDLTTPQKVVVKVYGKVLDENYSRVLYNHPEFDLETVFLIDKVQKNMQLDKKQLKRLRDLDVVEGRVPNIYISAQVAEIIDEKAQYIKNKGFNDDYYRQMIIEYLTQFGSGKKKDFLGLLLSKLPDILSKKQKEYKVQYLLKSLKNSSVIELDSNNSRSASWVLSKRIE